MSAAQTLIDDLARHAANLADQELDALAHLAIQPAIARSPTLSVWLRHIAGAEATRREYGTSELAFRSPDFAALTGNECAQFLLGVAILVEATLAAPRLLDVAVVLNKLAVCLVGARLLERDVARSN